MSPKDVSKRGTASLTETANKALLEDLRATYHKDSKSSAFAVGGFIPIVDPDNDNNNPDQQPYKDGVSSINESVSSDTNTQTSKQVVVRWDGIKDDGSQPLNRISFPVSSDQQHQLEKLVTDCQPATFGRGKEDVLDETYRRAGKLDETSFSTNFNPYSLGIVDIISKMLLPTISGDKVARSVRAELYKLNVYSGPDGKFKPHVDTPRSSSQFGSLVVCLPYTHNGGQLVVRHGGDELVFDWSTESAATGLSWTAFYSDCEHEVLKVTSGHRVTLTYNLYAVSTDLPQSMSALDPKNLTLYHKLVDLLAQPGFMKEGGTLGLYCAHAYAHTASDVTQQLPRNLKGIDMMTYQALKAAGLKVELRPVMDTDPDIIKPSYLYDSYRDIEWDSSKWGSFTEWVDDTKYKEERNPEETTEEDIEKRDRAIATWKEKGIDKDAVFVGEELEALAFSWRGGDGDSILDVYNDGIPGWEALHVDFLNGREHYQASIVHLAYGNEADIGTVYSSAAFIFKIPPFTERLDRY